MSYETVFTAILTADDAAREGGAASLLADLRLAETLKGANVTKVIERMTAEGKARDEDGVYDSPVREMFRTPGTWGKTISQARKVLAKYGKGSASDALAAIDTINANRRMDRVNGDGNERESYSLAYWYKMACPQTVKPPRVVTIATSVTHATTFVTTCDDVATLAALAELVATRMAELDNASADVARIYDAA